MLLGLGQRWLLVGKPRGNGGTKFFQLRACAQAGLEGTSELQLYQPQAQGDGWRVPGPHLQSGTCSQPMAQGANPPQAPFPHNCSFRTGEGEQQLGRDRLR